MPDTVSVRLPAVGVKVSDTMFDGPVPTSGPAVDAPVSVIVPVPRKERVCCTAVTARVCVGRVAVWCRILRRPPEGTRARNGWFAGVAMARSILKNIRANEQGGVILPNPEWEFFFADLQAGNTSDMWKSIDHHNREIAKNVLAQFLELGNTESGSRALSEDQSDFFLLSLEALANLIEEVHNRFLIHELVDLNFTVTEYPKLRHKKLGSVDYGTISNVLSTLVGAGIIEADDDLEDWARKTIDAPAKMIEEEPEEEEETEEGEEDEGTDPLTGEPIDPEDTTNPETPSEIDPETGEPVLPEEETEDAEDVTEGQDDGTEDIPYQVGDEGEPILDENGNYIDDEGNPIDEEGNPVDEDGNPLEASEFRAPVSEETKKKISEALKKNGGGKVDLKKVRTMRRQQRLAKRAKTSKRPAAKAPKAAKVPKMAKKAPKTAGARSLRRNASKRKAGRIAKRAGKTVKKPAAKKPSAPIGQRAKQQKNDPNSPLFKKKVLAHEHEQDEYDLIFAEGAKKIMMMQELVEFTKRDLPGGAQKFAELPATWRPYTFAEQKVNWPSLKSSVSKFQKALDTEVADITANQKADLLAQVRRAVEKNDIAGVGKIKAKYTGDLSSALTNVQKEMFEIGKSSISKEMGVATPNTASEVLGAMRVSNGKLSQKLTSDMENAAADAVSQTIMKKGGSISGTGTAEAVGQASAAIDRVLKQTGKINTLTLYGSLNLGRAAVYERYPEKVYAMQYSAIIDDVTTDRCLSLDGRVVKAGSPDYYSYGPPQHYECRSIWVEILEDEEFKPDTEEIPSKIPSTTTIDNVTELSAPVVTPNSPAIKSLQAEIDERKAKVEEYKASGQYQNRIALHQSRIDALEKAIGE